MKKETKVDESARRGQIVAGVKIEDRVISSTGSSRSDRTGKGRYDLIPPLVTRRLALRYEGGAIAHGPKIPISDLHWGQELVKFCTCKRKHQIVTPTVPTTLVGCVETVTRKVYGKSIQTLLENKEITLKSGLQKISRENEQETESITILKKSETESRCGKGLGCSQLMDLLLTMRKGLCNNREESVPVVEKNPNIRKDGCASITNTTLESLGVSSVEDAMQLLVSLEIALKELETHSPTCLIFSKATFVLRDGKLFCQFPGDRNWELGMDVSRCFDSAKRHMDEWAEGLTDEDHLGAALWNIAAIMFMQEKHPEHLDMPAFEEIQKKALEKIRYAKEGRN